MNYAPLQGIKVVDFTSVQSGPSCTQLLAWLGAEVIKIERPGVGDATRKELQFLPDEPSYYFLQLNSDKKSIALDAATPSHNASRRRVAPGRHGSRRRFLIITMVGGLRKNCYFCRKYTYFDDEQRSDL